MAYSAEELLNIYYDTEEILLGADGFRKKVNLKLLLGQRASINVAAADGEVIVTALRRRSAAHHGAAHRAPDRADERDDDLAEALLPRLTLSERYTYAGFSDGHGSDDLWLNARYAVLPASPKIAAGYRFRYWDFRRQSGGGYFDPENFTSHQLFASFSGEKNGFYVRFDPYGGYQSYLRYGIHTRGLFFGLPGAVGWTMKKCTAFELSIDGGNYAGGTVAGYNYYQVGSRLIAYF